MKVVFGLIICTFICLQSYAENLIITDHPEHDYYDHASENVHLFQVKAGERLKASWTTWPRYSFTGIRSYLHEVYDFQVISKPEGVTFSNLVPEIFPDVLVWDGYYGKTMDLDICISKPGSYSAFVAHRQITYEDFHAVDTIYRQVYHERELTQINLNILPGSGGDCSGDKPKLEIETVKLAQVVYNPQITPFTRGEYDKADDYVPLSNTYGSKDLLAVLGKSASFVASVKLSNADKNIISGTYTVQIKDSSGQVVSQSKPKSLVDLANGSPIEISALEMQPPSYSLYPSFIPQQPGTASYEAEVVVDSEQQIETSSIVFSINSVKTYTPSIVLTRIEDISYVPVNDYMFKKNLAMSQYISDLFPVADNSLTLRDGGRVKVKSVTGDRVVADLRLLEETRRLKFVNRIVGVGSYEYIDKVLPEAYGVYLPVIKKAVISKEDEMQSLVHELAHSFGVTHHFPENDNYTFEGFNANSNGFLGAPEKYTKVKSFMSDVRIFPGTDDGISGTLPKNYPWIDEKTYSVIFGYLQHPIVDPKTIMISGFINKSGIVSDLRVSKLANGVLDESVESGDLAINTLNKAGAVLGGVKMKSDFRIRILPREANNWKSYVEINSIPFVVELLDSDDIEDIQISVLGTQVLKMSLKGARVLGLVERIPLASFKDGANKTPQIAALIRERQKEQLLQLARNAQKEIDSRNKNRANAYLSALISQIKSFTSSAYVAVDEYELSPSVVVSELSKVISSL